MEEIKEFLKQFVQKEAEVHVAYRMENNIENFNQLFIELNAFTVNHIPEVLAKIGFGVRLMTKEHDEEFFEDLKFMRELCPRLIYKISEYAHQELGKIWLAYTSPANSGKGITKLLSSCFCITKVDGKLTIYREYIPDYDTKLWKNAGGFDGIDFYQLGTPISVERLLSPANDAWSIEEYNKNT